MIVISIGKAGEVTFNMSVVISIGRTIWHIKGTGIRNCDVRKMGSHIDMTAYIFPQKTRASPDQENYNVYSMN